MLSRMVNLFTSSAPTIKTEVDSSDTNVPDAPEHSSSAFNELADRNLNGFVDHGEREEVGAREMAGTTLHDDENNGRGVGSEVEQHSARKAREKKERKRKAKKARLAEEQAEIEENGPEWKELGLDDARTWGGVEDTANGNGETEPEPEPELHTNETPRAEPPRGSRGRFSTKKASLSKKRGLQEGVADEEGNAEDIVRLLNAARTTKNADRTTKSRQSKKAVQQENSAIGETRQAIEDTDEFVDGSAEQPEAVLEGLATLPQKIKKARKKARKAPQELVEDVQADENDSGALLHQPLAPAPIALWHKNDGQEAEDNLEIDAQLRMDIESSIAPSDQAGEDDGLKKVTKKASGKRKASDTAPQPKKRRKSKEKGTPNDDIRKFGTVLSSQTSSLDRSSSKQQEIGAAGPSPSSYPPILPPKKPQVTSRRKSQWTAINLRNTPSARATADPEAQVEEYHKPLQTQARADEDEAEEPEEPEQPEQLEESEEFETRKEPEKPEMVATPLKKRRKRRLPIGEPEASESAPAAKTPRKSMSAAHHSPKSEKKSSHIRQSLVLKGGRLTNDEIEGLSLSVEEYRDQNDLSQHAINDIIQSDAALKDSKELWQYICERNPDIPRRNVMNTCRRKFHNFEGRGSWTAEQDEELRREYERDPGKWKVIGERMNRFPEDVRDRWRNYLVCGDKRKKDFWDKAEEDRFRIVVQDCIDNVREMKRYSNDPRDADAPDDTLIDWHRVSKEMGHTRSRLQCIAKWKKLKEREESDLDDPTTLRGPISETPWRVFEAETKARLMDATEKLMLLQAIRDSGAGREGKIPWKVIQQGLNVRGIVMALKMVFRELREQIRGHESMKLQDIVAYLIELFEAAAPNEPEGFERVNVSFKPKKRRKTSSKSKNKENDQVHNDSPSGEGNGEGSSTAPKKRKKSKSKSNADTKSKTKAVLSEMFVEDSSVSELEESGVTSNSHELRNPKKATAEGVDDDAQTPRPKKKRKSVRERMTRQSRSQDSVDILAQPQDSEDDIAVTIEAIRSATKEKKPPVTAQDLKSHTSVVAGFFNVEAEEDAPRERDSERDKDVQSDGVDDYAHLESPDTSDIDHTERDAEDMDLDNRNTNYTLPGGPQAEDPSEADVEHRHQGEAAAATHQEEDEDEADYYQHPEETENDKNQTLTLNGLHRESSEDLDETPENREKRRSDRFGHSSSSREKGSFNGYERSDSVSSSGSEGSDIHAVPKAKAKAYLVAPQVNGAREASQEL